MSLINGIEAQAIKDVIIAHPYIGTLLYRYGIACNTCGGGTDSLREAASNNLDDTARAELERQINDYLIARQVH
ncbi:MAG: hypothetical protein C0615_06900 [Desulfuromonas sp.]|nr:MAG: hypothetical protein C0615_06900 [Desulfuromonas sp.]